jgi:sodium-dependent dicarboxylate transporter 2/3/5
MMEARFDDRRKAVGWILGPAAALLIWILPIDTVSAPAHRLAGVLAWVGVYWVTEPIPIPVTALWGAALCVVMGVGSAKEVLSSFAHPVIFLFLGSFLLAEAMTVHGLDRRIAVGILSRRWVGADPYRLLFTTGGLTAFLSMWISNTAAAAMMFPIALGLLSSIQADSWTMKPAPYKTGFMLMTAYSASVGGIGTLIGTPPNLIGVGLIEQQTGVRLSFLQWMSFGLPMLVLMYLALYLLLSRRFPWSGELRGVAARLQEERMRLGGFTVGQRNVLSAFGVAVTLWVFPGVIALWAGTDSPAYQWYDRHLPEGISAILAAGLLFFLPTDRERGEFTLNWEQASRIDWGTILLFGGGLALGDQMFKTGLAEAMGKGLVEGLGFD